MSAVRQLQQLAVDTMESERVAMEERIEYVLPRAVLPSPCFWVSGFLVAGLLV